MYLIQRYYTRVFHTGLSRGLFYNPRLFTEYYVPRLIKFNARARVREVTITCMNRHWQYYRLILLFYSLYR